MAMGTCADVVLVIGDGYLRGCGTSGTPIDATRLRFSGRGFGMGAALAEMEKEQEVY